MKKVQINLSLLACITAFISIPTGCGNTNTNKNAEVKNMVWIKSSIMNLYIL